MTYSAHSASLDPENLKALKQAYDRDGFVIINGLLEQYGEARLKQLREATETVIRATRDGKWEHR